MPRLPHPNLLDRLVLLTLKRARASTLHLHEGVIDRQHDDTRPGDDAEQGDGGDGAEVSDPGLRGVEDGGGGEEGAGDDGGDEEGILLDLMRMNFCIGGNKRARGRKKERNQERNRNLKNQL